MRFSIFALVFGALLAACHSNPSFRTTLQGQMTIAGDPLGGALNSFPPASGFTSIDFNQNQDFRNVGIAKDAVNSAVIDSVQLKITDPSTQDFSFLDSLQLVARTGSQEAVIAQKSSIRQLNLRPPNPTLSLDTTGAQLKPYVTAASMSIVVRGSGNAPPNDTQISITAGMEVEIRGY